MRTPLPRASLPSGVLRACGGLMVSGVRFRSEECLMSVALPHRDTNTCVTLVALLQSNKVNSLVLKNHLKV